MVSLYQTILKALILFILGGFLFFPKPVLALQTYQTGPSLLVDDFSDGNLDGWKDETGNGGWSILNGTLLGEKHGQLISARLTRTETGWDNYVVEMDLVNMVGVDEGIGFRRADKLNAYEVTLRHGIGAYNTPEVVLTRVQNGVATVLKSTHNLSLVNGNWHHLKIEAFQEHFQIYINNQLVIEADDPGTTVKTGPISVALWTGTVGHDVVRFDNIRVNSLYKNYFPVIFIPGIGGSEFKANQDILWNKDNGHGGTFSHAYPAGEKVWVNQGEAIKPGDDDYFDVLKLKPDGVTPEADLTLTGELTPLGYGEIDSFFSEIGYSKGINYFTFPYDWRKDVRSNNQLLDQLVETAKQKSGQPKVNLVVHSMGGLVARDYISTQPKADKVNKLIELGVPHLGAVKGLEQLVYGHAIGKPILNIYTIGVNGIEVKDVLQNFPSAFQLLPSLEYFSFYNNTSKDLPLPFRDDRDIDNNFIKGFLNYPQLKELFQNINLNQTTFGLAEQFHNLFDPQLNQSNGVKLYNIVGSNQPTLGQIQETWWITWPISLIPRKDEIFINGDATVPLYSASLKADHKDLSGGAKIYYVDQKHEDLVRKATPSMATVKMILLEGDSLPVDVQSQKFLLSGKQLSIDDATLDLYDPSGNHTGLNANGEIETNIPGTFFDLQDSKKHAFIKKSAPKVTVKITPKSTDNTQVKLRHYNDDAITQTAFYPNIPNIPIQTIIDPISDASPNLNAGNQTISPITVTGEQANDSTPPVTQLEIKGDKGNQGYKGEVTISLASNDSSSGVQKIEYSLDNGLTVEIYNVPITLTKAGTYTIQFFSTDKLGNQELPQTLTFTIKEHVSNGGSSNSSSTTNSSSTVSPVYILSSTFNNLPSIFHLPPSKSSPPLILGATKLKLAPITIYDDPVINWLLMPLWLIIPLSVWLMLTFKNSGFVLRRLSFSK